MSHLEDGNFLRTRHYVSRYVGGVVVWHWKLPSFNFDDDEQASEYPHKSTRVCYCDASNDT